MKRAQPLPGTPLPACTTCKVQSIGFDGPLGKPYCREHIGPALRAAFPGTKRKPIKIKPLTRIG